MIGHKKGVPRPKRNQRKARKNKQGKEQAQSRHRAGAEQAQSKHGAGTEQAQSKDEASTEQAHIRHGTGKEQAWTNTIGTPSSELGARSSNFNALLISTRINDLVALVFDVFG